MRNLTFTIVKTLILAFISLNVSAGEGRTALDEISAAHPNAEKKEILRLFYEDSSSPARIEDFPLTSDQTSTQQCRLSVAMKGKGDELYSVYIKAIEVQREDGPLFPVSERKLSLISSTPDSEPRFREAHQSIFRATTMETSSSDLIATTRQTYAHVDSPSRILLRRHGEFISFKFVKLYSPSNGPLFEEPVRSVRYGYCW